jgi:hypothetical protein
MATDPHQQAIKQATQSRGFPQGFKSYSPYPFAGMNYQDTPIAIDDREFVYVENFLRIGTGRLRTAWDAGPAAYTTPTGLTIVSFFFFTIGTANYVALFLSDGSAIQFSPATGSTHIIGPAGTFYHKAATVLTDRDVGWLPACAGWGTLYLIISNRNSTNDYWIWDGTTLYSSGTAAPNGVVIASNGKRYNTVPTVSVYGGHGSGITLTPSIQAGGVVQIQITNPGTGYQVGDILQVQFTGGGSDSSAILTAITANGTVTAVNITSNGIGYTTATASFAGGGGTGAAGTPVIGSAVTTLTLTNQGTGYTGANVSFTGGGGTGASADATVNGGQVVSLTLTSGGTGYTSAPTVNISGNGTGATATSTINAGVITGITMTNFGSGYTSAPSVSIAGDGTGATAVALLAPNGLSGVTVTNGGSGFTYPPLLTFVGGGGTGATAVAKLTGTSVSKINVTNSGSFYSKRPTIQILGNDETSALAVNMNMANGQVISVDVLSGGSGYTSPPTLLFIPQKGDTTGSGAAATAVLTATSIGSVQLMNHGKDYTDAPAVVIAPGANQSAYATIAIMPFSISGGALETYGNRVWIADPSIAPYGTLPPGGNWTASAPGSFTDFATSDGGVLFSNSDGFLQTKYTAIRQANGYLYFFGDGSISVVSNVATSGNPATTTFNYQNADPQTGCSWRDSLQAFGKTVLFGNATGVYGLYGGSATKVSAKLDQLFRSALFPPSSTDLTTGTTLAPTAAVATLFDVKHYMMLMSFLDPDTGLPVNKMVAWNEKDWCVTSQSVNLTYIGTQKVESKFTAWGTDGTKFYPLFQTPSATLSKRLITKAYGGDSPLMVKEYQGLWMSAQDQSSALAGVNCSVNFNISGLAIQSGPTVPQTVSQSVPNVVIGGSIPTTNLLYSQPVFTAPPPAWPVFGTGSGGAAFTALQAELTTASPDFILSHLVLGYTDVMAFFAGS